MLPPLFLRLVFLRPLLLRPFLLNATFAAVMASTLPAPAETLSPVRQIETTGDFDAAKPGKPARDVSGLACMPEIGGKRRCLLINDENRSAQFAILAGAALTPVETVPLLTQAPSPATLGSPPPVPCRNQGGFRDLDGESVAFAAPYFYVAGSHGCSRRSGQFRLSAFLLARIRVDAEGRVAAAPDLSYRLGDLLPRAGQAGPFFGRDLMGANGMNIEAIAVVGDRLWAGLRAPSLDGKGFIVGASLADLFAAGHERAKTEPTTVAIPLGTDRGFRDLASLPDGRLVALAGPAQEQDLPYSLVLFDPARPGDARELGTLPQRREAKAEALTILSQDAAGLRLLIGYDGPRNGRFEEYLVPWPR